jgi:2-C-methyl-D-erythritol 2,4-cyclodiphosphate synthase
MNVRVGFGFDVHQLGDHREFWLGGVRIPYERGAVGHSDADVLIHAICDALLGAAGLRDIGFYFPDTSQEFKNIDSKLLLARVMKLLGEKGYRTGNIDSTICLEAPKINPFIPEMKKALASVMEVSEDDISIKATTNEKMGYVGRKEGIRAYAVALLFKN